MSEENLFHVKVIIFSFQAEEGGKWWSWSWNELYAEQMMECVINLDIVANTDTPACSLNQKHMESHW